MMERCFYNCVGLSNLIGSYTGNGDFAACTLCLYNPDFKKEHILPSYWLLHMHRTPGYSVLPHPALAFLKSDYPVRLDLSAS